MNLIEELIAALQRMVQQQKDDALLRAIVRDNRTSVHPALQGGKVTVDGAPVVKTVGDGRGWSNTTPSIDDWRPPGEKVFDALMNAEDAKWRAERAAELAKLKGGKP
jgi:hypothetical protein